MASNGTLGSVDAGGTRVTTPARRRGPLYAALLLAAVAAASAAALAADLRHVYILVYAWFGLAYGALLQYGRFCMASAARDLFAVRVPRMAVGILVAIVPYALAAAVVQGLGHSTFGPHPWGWHIVIGALIFGFGMVFSGGCASSSLYKSGEGNIAALLTLLSISFTQAWFVSQGGWLDRLVPASWSVSAAAKHMPAQLNVNDGWFDQFTAGYVWNLPAGTVSGWLHLGNSVPANLGGNAVLGAIVPALLLAALIYLRYYRRGVLRRHGGARLGLRGELAGFREMITASRHTAIAGLGLGLLAALQMWVTDALRNHYGIFNFGELLAAMGHDEGLSIQDSVFDPGYWYITTQEAQWGGWVLARLGRPMMDNLFFGLDNGLPSPLLNAPGFMSIGIVLGAAVLANFRDEFRWKRPSLETALFALAGGAFMGIGARLALGCNIGAFFATVTNGDATGWVFLAGMAAGGYAAVKLFQRWVEWRMAAQLG